MHPLTIVERFPSLRLLVVGDAILDAYVHGDVERLAREAPAPVVRVRRRDDVPGGAANAAVNVATLGAGVLYVGATGDDAEADALERALRARSVDTTLVREPGRRTLTKRRVVSDSQIMLRLDEGDIGPVREETAERVADAIARAWASCDAVLVSDYGYGLSAPAVVQRIAALHAAQPKPLFVDARDPARYASLRPAAVKPNYDEAVRLLGGQREDGHDRVEAVTERAARLLDLTGAYVVAVTLDRDGAMILERGRPPYRTYARPARNAAATGAGDTFSAALALAIAAGADGPTAGELASTAAGVVVRRDGTTTCSHAELAASFASPAKLIAAEEDLRACVAGYRAAGRRIVFTNGCFDILHRGHITYLNQAKSLGDLLVVGINSDESVARLKGAGRPVNALEDRAHVLAALSAVDHVVPFGSTTAEDLIRIIRPDVYVKGGDYAEEMIAEAPLVRSLGGELRVLPYVEDRSTTALIDRIRSPERVSLDERVRLPRDHGADVRR